MANQPINLKVNNVSGTTSISGTLSIVNCDTLQVITVSGYTFSRLFTTTGTELSTGTVVQFTDIPENIIIPANHKVRLTLTIAGQIKTGFGPCQASSKAVCILATNCNITIKGFEKVSNTEFKAKLNSSALGPFSVLIKQGGETKLSRNGLVGVQVGLVQPASQNIVFEAWKSGLTGNRQKIFDFDGISSKPINTILSETQNWTFFATVRVPFDRFIFKVTRPNLTSQERTFDAGYISGERKISWLEETYGEAPTVGIYLVNIKLYRNGVLVVDETSTLTITYEITNNIPPPTNPYVNDRSYVGGTLEEVPNGQDFNGVAFKRSQAPILDGIIRLSPRAQGNFYEFDEQTGKNIFLTQRFPKNFTSNPNRVFSWMGPFAKDLTDRATLLTRGVTHFAYLPKALELNLPSTKYIGFVFGAEVSDAKNTSTAAYTAAIQLEQINPSDPRVASLKRYGLENRPDGNLGAYVYLGKYLYNRYIGQFNGGEIPYFLVDVEAYEGTQEDFQTSQFGIMKGVIERAKELGHNTKILTYYVGSFIQTANPIANGQLNDNYFRQPMSIWNNFTSNYSNFAQQSDLYEGRDQYIRATWDDTSLFQKNLDGSLKLGTNGRHLYVTGARNLTVFGTNVQVTSNESQHYCDSLYSEMESILANWRYSCNTSLSYDGSQIVGQMPYPEGTGSLRPSINKVKHGSLFRDSTEGFEGPIRDLSNNGAVLPQPTDWDQRPVNKRLIESTLLARCILYHSTMIWSYHFNPQWEWGKPQEIGNKTSLGQFEIMLKANHRSQNFPELFDLMDEGKIDFIIPRRFIYKGNEVKGDYVYEKPIVWFLKEKNGRRVYAYWCWPVQDMGTEHERDMKFWIELQNGNKTQSYSFKFKNREAGFERFLLPVGFELARSQDCFFQFKSLINETITWRGNYNYVAPANTVAPILYDGTAINNPVEPLPVVNNQPPPVIVTNEDSSYDIPTGNDQWPLVDNRTHPKLNAPIGDYFKLQNEFIDLRCWKRFGGAICHISVPGGANMVNNYDLGRQVNDTLYRGGLTSPNPNALIEGAWATAQGGGVGNNPISSGNYYEDASNVQRLKFIPNGVYMEVLMRNWAVDEEFTDVIVCRWIRLIGREIKINLKFINARTGDQVSYDARQQELPCIYVNTEWNKAVYYNGSEPFKGLPLTYNTNGNMIPFSVSENFIAMVNSQNEGLAITGKRLYLVTNEEFTGSGGEFGSGSTYIAGVPLLHFSWNEVYKNEYSVIVGHINQIRDIVTSKQRTETPVFRFDSVRNRNDFQFEKGFEDYSWPIPDTGWRVKAKKKQLKIVSCPLAIKPSNIEKLYIRFAAFGTITDYKFGWDQIGETALQSAQADHTVAFTVNPDGVYRTIVIDLKASNKLTDIVSKFFIQYAVYNEDVLPNTEGFSILWINTSNGDPLASLVPVQTANPCNFSHMQVIGKWGSDDIVSVNFANQWWIAHRVIINGRDALFIRGTNFLTRNDIITTFGSCISSFSGAETAFGGLVPPASFTTPVGYTKYNTADGNSYYQTGLIA